MSLENCRHVFNSGVFMSDSFEANGVFLIDELIVKIDKEGTEGCRV